MKNRVDYTKYINIFLVGYAFCLPISKAGVNFFEFLLFLFWILEGNWKDKWNQIKSNLLSISIIALIVVSIISLPNASSIEFGIKYILKYRHFLIILVILTSLKKEYIKYIFSGFILGMFISEIISYGIFFKWWHYKNISPSDPSPFMSHTDYSVYLAFTSSILLLRLFEKNISFKEKIFYLLFFLSVTTNLFVNGGRTGQVIFVALILLVFIKNFKNKIKALFLSSFILATILILAYNFSPVFHNRVNQAKYDIKNMIYKKNFHGSFATRVSLWILGSEAIYNAPFYGYGIGNDMKQTLKISKELGFDANKLKSYSDNHNTFITLILQLGIFGVLIIFFIYYALFRLNFLSNYFNIMKYIFIIAFFAWSFGGITFHTMYPMIFFTLFAGLFNKISQIEQKGEIITF